VATLRLHAAHLGGMHHRATIDGFTIESDEPPALGGEDAHPKPLDYLTAAIAFCTLTQLLRLAPLLDVTLDAVECTVETDWSSGGSVRLGTNRSRCDAVRLETTITSTSDRARVAELVARAEAACYVMAALRDPVHVVSRTVVNDVPLTGA
jgi:uncharacterized OsmC-like protein